MASYDTPCRWKLGNLWVAIENVNLQQTVLPLNFHDILLHVPVKCCILKIPMILDLAQRTLSIWNTL